MLQSVLSRAWPAVLAVLAALALSSAPASAHTASATGGASADELDVTGFKCGTGEATSCPQGQVLRVSGEGLARTRSVTFLGARGKRDDRTARPTEKSPHRVIVAVPSSARSGPLKIVAAGVARKGPRLRVLPGAKPPAPTSPPPSSQGPTPPSSVDGGVFPVQGAHDYGTEINRFGGGRNHKGQDVFAKCRTPIVAAVSGVVSYNRFHAQGGNYVVVKADDGTGQAYMHMLSPGSVKPGRRVAAGQQIGQVGETGRASGCHLHFELWTAPGWYEGGQAIDPLPTLKRWDAGR